MLRRLNIGQEDKAGAGTCVSAGVVRAEQTREAGGRCHVWEGGGAPAKALRSVRLGGCRDRQEAGAAGAVGAIRGGQG